MVQCLKSVLLSPPYQSILKATECTINWTALSEDLGLCNVNEYQWVSYTNKYDLPSFCKMLSSVPFARE